MSMLSFTSTSTNNHQVKNVSLSSYPSMDDDTFVPKLTDTTQAGLGLARKEEEDGELRVFGAEKYFNGRIDEESPKHQLHQYKKEDTTTDHIIMNRQGSSSIQSASSWNSQSALLQSVTKVRSANKSRRKSFLGSLSCKCVCSDKESVDIAQDYVGVGDIKSTRYSLDPIKTVHGKPHHKDSWTNNVNKERCFSLPNPNLPLKKQLELEDQEKARMSLQEDTEFEDNGVYESGSDASSDLFEIESLTGKANPFLARDVPSGCVTPTTCYAPSEASIEWSVVTASAADFSALSDSEDHRFSPSLVGAKTKPTKGIAPRRRPNILLSCKSNKSVRVAGDAAYIASDKVHSPRTRHASHPMVHVTRFQGGNKMIGFDSRQQHGFAKHHITRSHSPRASHLLYIQ